MRKIPGKAGQGTCQALLAACLDQLVIRREGWVPAFGEKSRGRRPPEKSAERSCVIFRFPDIYHKTEQNSRRGRGVSAPHRIRSCLDRGCGVVIGHRMLWSGPKIAP